MASSLAPPCSGPLSAAIGAGDGAEHVGERRGDDARGERRGVHRVVGVEDERGVERVGVLGGRAPRRGASTGSSPRGGASGSAAGPPGRSEGGGRCAMSDGLFAISRSALRYCASARLVPPVGVVGATPPRSPSAAWTSARSAAAASGISLARNGESSRSSIRNSSNSSSSIAGRQLQVMEEVDDLFERGVFGQVRDVVADVPQRPSIAVDVGDLRLRGDDLAESLVGHVPSFLRANAAHRGDTRASRRFCQDRRRDGRLPGGCRGRRPDGSQRPRREERSGAASHHADPR